ncbi:TPA: superoxide dismutase [Candidatus Bathyarchaeota archaeon]|nr:superoxide dismutase [Candidatus Bathyarchaeota archaeon]HIJ08635.1 superoxide dismutase [Candidatus Bathyarchaeota archaeon]
MESVKSFSLPKLPYAYNALAPFMSEQQLTIHHDKHHQGYVNGANAIFEKLEKTRKENVDLDVKSTLKELSFHIGGHLLHSTFWDCMAPTGKGGGKPNGAIADVLMKEFGSFERFKMEFSKAATSVEGSGWAALVMHQCVDRPLIMQIEKHNLNLYPAFRLLMVLDLWEHAYYIDYKNDRGKFVEGFWSVVNWDYVNKVYGLVK